MIDTTKILTGQPNQNVTGAILSAPRGTALPETALAPIDKDFNDSGFISEDGITTTIDKSYADIRDWSGRVRRKILKETTFDLEFSFLSFDIFALTEMFGKDNITITEKTDTHGEQITVKILVDELPRKSYIINMKDGKSRMRIVIPDGQVITESIEMSFKSGEAIILPVKLHTFPDSNEEYAQLLFDDGNYNIIKAGGNE
jgi:hypothetical protein